MRATLLAVPMTWISFTTWAELRETRVPTETSAAAAVVSADAGGSPTFVESRAEWRRKEAEYLTRIDALKRELVVERELREAREHDWLEFTQVVAALEVPSTPDSPAFLHAGLREAAEAAEADLARAAEATAALGRGREILRDLRALLQAEQVLGLDFLEVGAVRDGSTGPVVVRLLDDWGRPSGTLAADRLRIECSRAGRNVTLVFEEGFESRAGVPTPFGPPSAPGGRRGGLRRIYLSSIDPEPWIERLPELFDKQSVQATPDDGLWGLLGVRSKLNELLRASSRGGDWRVKALGGVVRGVLREVHLVQLGPGGAVTRRVFADRMRIEKSQNGILLLLEDGVQERTGRSAPFLEGRYRIYLPGADVDQWERAQLPGLSEPRREAAPQAASVQRSS